MTQGEDVRAFKVVSVAVTALGEGSSWLRVMPVPTSKTSRLRGESIPGVGYFYIMTVVDVWEEGVRM